MAKNYCTFIPSRGKTLFKELRKQFGYSTARSVFLKALNPEFIGNYKDTLSLDAEGIPTYESLMQNKFIQSYVGEKRMSEVLSSRYSPMEDNLGNYSSLLESAFQFNTTDAQRDNYIATVEHTDEGVISVVVQPKTKALEDKFKNQYSSHKLNDRLASIFQPLGITVDVLTDAEVKAGRIGVTDFSVARDMANGFASMIRVANNMEGATALSEEFSHLIIGVFRKDPLVTRSINALMNDETSLKSILGDHYEDTYNFYNGDMSMIAEEALGHVLQKNLLNHTDNLPTLFRRMLDWIINKFRPYSLNRVQDAIDSVDTMMNTLSQEILSGTRQITQSDIAASRREAQFNALSDKIDRNIEILKEAAKTETKRFKVTKGGKKEEAEVLVSDILSYTKEDADTVAGLFHYAKHALSELRNLEAQFRMIDGFTPELKFKLLRSARMFTQSYGRFIKSMNEAMISDEMDEDNMFLRDFNLEGNTVTIQEVVNELNSLSEQLTRRYSLIAFPAFAEFMKPFIGEEITIPYGTYAGTKLSVETLLKEAEHDISFMDRWLDSMADSADLLLQGFDAVVKKAETTARLNTMDDIRTIQAFREKAEKQGITDFDWMFETDSDGNKSGNYISEINYAQFAKDLKDFTTYINDKYGKNPTGDEAQAKLAEIKVWRKEHCLTTFTSFSPNPIRYKSKQYAKLSSTQKALLNEFLTLKEKFDAKLPDDRVARNKAIQIRKSGTQRLFDSMTSPSALFSNLKETVEASLLDREDDDQLFGDSKVSKGLTDFAGEEFMTLPVLYTNVLSNPNELSTDAIGSLMAYAYMANQYEEMDKIVDPLEVGKTLVTEERVVKKTRGDKQVIEKFKALGVDVANSVLVTRSNAEQKLQDFMESRLYHRYLKDEGTFNILGTQININKSVSLLLKASSMAQLGLNWLANMANVATGLSMQNIEAAAGQFFTPKELGKADLEYGKNLTPMLAELGSRTKTNKLSLFFELFDIKQDFGKNVKSIQNKSWLKRLFGADIAFLGQAAGDHWLYGRTAIAMAIKEKVLLGSKEMSLWDALQVVDTKKGSTKELNYKDIKALDGTSFDVGKFSRKVAHINQSCFGVYSDEDSNAANRVAMGRLLQQYRKWMKAQYNRRFQAVQRNLATDTWEEGYYRTVGRLMNQLLRGQIQLAGQWDRMSLEEKANVKRAIMEMVQFFAVWALANWIEWPDDKRRPWAQKLAEYSCKRLAHELGGLAPSTVMPQELLKTVKNPIPSTSTIQNLFNLVNSCADPTDWNNTISSGPYKGMSTLQKNFIKSPLPIVPQYRQIDKFIGDLDTSIQYYMRPSN